MKEPALTTIFTAESSAEAEGIISCLRGAGMHPADLGLTTPVPLDHSESKFPIKVPTEEVEQAKIVLESRPQPINV